MSDFDGTYFTQRIEQAIRMAIQDGFRLILEDRKFDTSYAAHTCGECAWLIQWPGRGEAYDGNGYCRKSAFGGENDRGEVLTKFRACPALALLPKGKVDEEKETAEV